MKQKSSIEIIFPFILLTLFTISSLFLIGYSFYSYKEVVTQGNQEQDMRLALAYIKVKVTNGNEEGSVEVVQHENQNYLKIETIYEGETYATYIYQDDNKIKELYALSSYPINFKDGTTLFTIEDMDITQTNQLLRVRLTHQGKQKVLQILLQEGE